MQTFLPYPDFAESARVLDRQRLGKQRVEALQIYRLIMGFSKGGWSHHPAVLMWQGYGDALAMYLEAMIDEWVSRGYKNTIVVPNFSILSSKPGWIGHEEFHASHRAALLAKKPDWYQSFGWTEEPKIAYFWPTKHMHWGVVQRQDGSL